jgi:tRNA-specific 2-thiouridylase
MNQPNSNKKVLIAMSGGVDSSVSAALLKEQGYEVIGATMQIWQTEEEEERENGCCSLTAVNDARRVADKLGIPYYVLNFRDIFRERVIEYFIREYQAGRTPNPCIVCNKEVKFEALLDKAISMGLDYIATGHYAQVEFKDGRYLLKKAISKTKDQTYALYNLTQDQLSKTLFPVGRYEKDQIRQIAKKYDLGVASKPDSQEICFVEDNDYAKFISEYADSEIYPGDIVDTKENVLGKHNGVFNYTVGQRKGLGIPSNMPLYVVEIDIEKNQVVVGSDEETFSNKFIARDLNWIGINKLEKEMRVEAKIRYGAKEAPAIIKPIENEKVEVFFDTPQRAITPGQSAVFYDGDYVVGGGVIENS